MPANFIHTQVLTFTSILFTTAFMLVFHRRLPLMQLFTKSRIRPLQCVQWTRKEGASIFSILQFLNKVFCLKWMQLIPDLLSVTPGSPPRFLSAEKVRDSVCSQNIINRKDMAAVTGPAHHQGSLLQWAGVFCSVVPSDLCFSTHTRPPSPPPSPPLQGQTCITVTMLNLT